LEDGDEGVGEVIAVDDKEYESCSKSLSRFAQKAINIENAG